ncbi:uncharacterized protein AMSG_04728 [Thecamonas trahens ATCC 50062]|uniref:Uncharacterized protein n=1 Tax=Thecamonas trahens ATCC 50062 TaxID=461836 RepID=A0A0L0D9Q4_THETB|nr:hypothetical protein AMSG_04728 [Thecamonas trahens ATCC 50062]KNC48985.1 hypothetical protein AMSG_04728 [Thecamonas trahens ATCC 50062]|eukprot:XP_013758400.1 hypothetical protein AMSG_04728 [Thecamonas trahens ATCC 50062]
MGSGSGSGSGSSDASMRRITDTARDRVRHVSFTPAPGDGSNDSYSYAYSGYDSAYSADGGGMRLQPPNALNCSVGQIDYLMVRQGSALWSDDDDDGGGRDGVPARGLSSGRQRRRRRRKRKTAADVARPGEGLISRRSETTLAFESRIRGQFGRGGSTTALNSAFACIDVEYHSLAGMETQRMVPNFLHYVYLKNDDLESCPGVLIPDTVLFIDGAPAEWLFMSKDGRILKKRQDRLRLSTVRAALMRETSYRRGPVLATLTKVRHNVGGDESFMSVKYLTAESFDEAFEESAMTQYMVLQRFVDPHGVHNETIKVAYAGLDTTLERRRNVHAFEDDNVDLATRLQVFEGRNPPSVAVPWALRESDEFLRDKVHKLAFDIANHVRVFSVRHHHIHSMNLFLKVGPKQRLWLLSASHVVASHESTRNERVVAGKIMRRISAKLQASAEATRQRKRLGETCGESDGSTALSKAIGRFKDLRPSVFAGTAPASDPKFVQKLLRKEVARLQAVLHAETSAIADATARVDTLEAAIASEDRVIAHLRRLAASQVGAISTFVSMADLHSQYKARVEAGVNSESSDYDYDDEVVCAGAPTSVSGSDDDSQMSRVSRLSRDDGELSSEATSLSGES